MNRITKIFIILGLLQNICQPGFSQNDTIYLTLDDVIQLAQDSSLTAFRARNMFLASYWQFKQFKAQNLPTLGVTSSPLRYNRSIERVYSDSISGYDNVETQTLRNNLNINIIQNLTITGGRITMDSDISRNENILNRTRFGSVPVRIGILQPIFAYNDFKWQKKIEPLRFDLAKREYLRSSEDIAFEATNLFFNYALAQRQLELAKLNLANSDSLYLIGQKRYKITSIEKTELLTLKVETLNARTQVDQARNSLKRAQLALTSYLGFKKLYTIKPIIPTDIPKIFIDEQQAIDLAIQNNTDFKNLTIRELESQSELERLKRNGNLNANLNASIGFNKSSKLLKNVYSRPDQQENVNLTFNIPIVDWGLRKARYRLAERQYETNHITIQQNEVDLIQNLKILVDEFNLQGQLIERAIESKNISVDAYEMAKKRFISGRIDVITLSMYSARNVNASMNYLQSIQQFWNLYYRLRAHTMFDFEKKISIMKDFDFTHGLN